jgi:hypothetical protein
VFVWEKIKSVSWKVKRRRNKRSPSLEITGNKGSSLVSLLLCKNRLGERGFPLVEKRDMNFPFDCQPQAEDLMPF